MKKLLTVLLTALMVVTLGVVNVAAEGEETAVLEAPGTEETVLGTEDTVDFVDDEGVYAKFIFEDGKDYYTLDDEITIVVEGGNVLYFNNINPLDLTAWTEVEFYFNGSDAPTKWTSFKDRSGLIDGLVDFTFNAEDIGVGELSVKVVTTYYGFYNLYTGTEHSTTIPKDKAITVFSKEYEYPELKEGRYVYNGEEQTVLELDPEVYSYTGDAPTQTDAGQYNLTLTLVDPDACFVGGGTYAEYSWTIHKANLPVEADNFAITNDKTEEAEVVVHNYEELKETLGEVKFVDKEGEELPYEVVTLYTGSVQSHDVAIVKLGAGFGQRIYLEDNNYFGRSGKINVIEGFFDVTATDLKFKKGSKKDRTITLTLEHKKDEETEVNAMPYYTVDGVQLERSFYEVKGNTITLKGSFLKTLGHGDHEFAAHNVYGAPGVCAKSNIHVSHNTNNDDTVKIVSTGIE